MTAVRMSFRRIGGSGLVSATARIGLIVCGVFGSATCLGADPDANEFFEKQVRPILVERCVECHGSTGKAKGGLRLTSRAGVLSGGESGAAAVPGKPGESLIVEAIQYVDEPRMPPSGKLGGREIETLTRWVALGLPWPESNASVRSAPVADTRPAFTISAEQRAFWSFQPVKSVEPPSVHDGSWPESAIDRFVLARLESRGLRPAPPADPRTLIRRATYDLTGLPPSPDEVDAFVSDHSAYAYEALIDRLLASPRYGERWGRHWLDLVRYTDSFDARSTADSDTDIHDSWRYRDWVIDALNRDLPYDRFVRRQIAGDVITEGESEESRIEGTIASGLLAIGNWGGGDADKEKLLTDIADDQVDVVSRAFLGLTVACARCHDHKFDPISTRDYYALAGIFFSTHILPNVGPKTNGPPMLRIPLLTTAEKARRARDLARLNDLEARLDGLRAWISHDVAQSLLAATALHVAAFSGPSPHSAWHEIAQVAADRETLKKNPPPPIPYANGAQEGGVPGSPQEGVHDVRVHIRGSYSRLADLVPRRFPVILAGESQPKIVSGSGRRELAEWITRPDHPLTARVIVNRVWQHHFGSAIVRTPSNFGKLGEPPTHPELLDYLARRLVDASWSLKALHRAIMLSASYRQSSEGDQETFRADPDNRLFGRMSRRRLDAESIRDTLLLNSGRLDLTSGGPPTRDPGSPRRSLYLMTIRSDRSSFGPLFDAADPTAVVDTRTVSTVAPQALYLLNNAFVLNQSAALARRLEAEAPGDDTFRIGRAYALLFGRPPTDDERRIGVESLSAFRKGANVSAWTAYCHVLLCTNEWIYID